MDVEHTARSLEQNNPLIAVERASLSWVQGKARPSESCQRQQATTMNTIYEVIDAAAYGLQHSAALQHWQQENYPRSEEIKILRGVNFSDLPHKRDAPFIALHPASEMHQRTHTQFVLRMTLGVFDEAYQNRTLRGLQQLSALFVPLAVEALGGVFGKHLEQHRVSYDIGDHPVLYADVDLTIRFDHALGYRTAPR